MKFYRIVFELQPGARAKTTYVRAESEDRAKAKLFDRYKEELIAPHVFSIELADGEFITD